MNPRPPVVFHFCWTFGLYFIISSHATADGGREGDFPKNNEMVISSTRVSFGHAVI